MLCYSRRDNFFFYFLLSLGRHRAATIDLHLTRFLDKFLSYNQVFPFSLASFFLDFGNNPYNFWSSSHCVPLCVPLQGLSICRSISWQVCVISKCSTFDWVSNGLLNTPFPDNRSCRKIFHKQFMKIFIFFVTAFP